MRGRTVMTIGEIFKERRLAKKMTLRAVAAEAGISTTEVYRIETGERIRSSTQNLLAVGRALGLPNEETLRLAGYNPEEGDIPLIEKIFPDMKTEYQQRTVQHLVDSLARNPDLSRGDYADLTRQIDMFLDYVRKKRS